MHYNLGGRSNVGPANRATGDVSNGERRALSCPDGGACHHECERLYKSACWRVSNAAPLTASGWEDWPEPVKREHLRRIITPASIEDVLVGGGAEGQQFAEADVRAMLVEAACAGMDGPRGETAGAIAERVIREHRVPG